MESGVASKSPYIDLKVQRHVLPSVIERGDRSANLIQSNCQVLGLPFPQNSIQIAMMQVE